jgi:hypothetical protein
MDLDADAVHIADQIAKRESQASGRVLGMVAAERV